MEKQSFHVRALLLAGAGIFPLIPGFLLNWLISAVPSTLSFLTLLAILLLLVWGYCSFKLSVPTVNFLLQAFLMCAFGLLMLMLVLYQELVRGEYWQNVIGTGSQLFFLPWLSLAGMVTGFFMHVIRVWPAYVVSWIGLFLASCAGCFMKQHK